MRGAYPVRPLPYLVQRQTQTEPPSTCARMNMRICCVTAHAHSSSSCRSTAGTSLSLVRVRTRTRGRRRGVPNGGMAVESSYGRRGASTCGGAPPPPFSLAISAKILSSGCPDGCASDARGGGGGSCIRFCGEERSPRCASRDALRRSRRSFATSWS